MELHKIIDVHEDSGKFLFRKMRVEGGFMYEFSDSKENNYRKQWVFVPDPIENENQKYYIPDNVNSKEEYLQYLKDIGYIKKLEHHKDTTVGLWATDRPDLIKDEKGIMFQISF